MNGALPVAHVPCPCALAWLAQGKGTLQLADPPMDDHERKKTRGRRQKEGRRAYVLYKERKSKQTKNKMGGQRANKENCSSSLLHGQEGSNDILALFATRVLAKGH